MNFTSPLGGIQQAGAPETGAKRVTPCFYLGLVTASTQIQVCIPLSPTSTPLPQVKVSHDMNSPAFTPYTQPLTNHGQLVNHSALIKFH